MPYYSCWVSDRNPRVWAFEVNHSGAECILSNPLLLGGGSGEGTPMHAQGQIALWGQVCLEAEVACERPPCRSRPHCLLVSQHLCSCGERGRSERQRHAPVQGCPGPCLPRWDLLATPEPAARLRRLQGFGVTLSSVPRFLFCFQRTPGPGTYTSSAQYPKQPRSIARMGREHSLFFNNTIGF